MRHSVRVFSARIEESSRFLLFFGQRISKCYVTTHSLFYLKLEVAFMKLTWFLGPNIVSRQWPLPKEQCDVIDDFFKPSTSQQWYVRVLIHIRHRHFVSKSRTASGVLCMHITSLMRALFRHRHALLEKTCFKTIWLAELCIVHST